jgi:outer membrane protein assembly factor BamB
VYSTFAGELSALAVEPNGFKPLWPSVKITDRPLSAPISIVQVALLTGKTLIAMPSDKKLFLVDLETGAKALGDRVPQTRAPITSPATAITAESLILAGCQDGRLYGLSLTDQPGREWNTGADASALRAQPQVFENQIIAPSENGQIYIFTPSRGGFGERIQMENAGAIHGGLMAKRRFYFGTNLREGIWCADIPSRRAMWKKTEPELGNITAAPALLDNTLFFGNDRAMVFAIDADKGVTKWTYPFDGGRPMLGSPMVHGRRVYFVNTDGRILAFDE